MRIDPKGTIAGKPALLVRDCLWTLARPHIVGSGDARKAAAVAAGNRQGAGPRTLCRRAGQERQARLVGNHRGRAALVVRYCGEARYAATAEKALREFLTRVERVNRDGQFLGRVNRVVLFGSMLREEIDRVSDVDLAVEVLPKITDQEELAAKNRRRVERLLSAGHRFRNILDMHFYWYREVFRFLKSGSRVISLADYAAEKSLIMNVPHRMLLGDEEVVPAQPGPEPPPRVKRTRRQRDDPF